MRGALLVPVTRKLALHSLSSPMPVTNSWRGASQRDVEPQRLRTGPPPGVAGSLPVIRGRPRGGLKRTPVSSGTSALPWRTSS